MSRNHHVLNEIGRLLQAGDVATARISLDQHRAQGQVDVPLLMMSGTCAVMEGKLDGARADFEAVLKIAPENPQARQSLSSIYMAKGAKALDEGAASVAKAAFIEALDVFDGHAEALLGLAKSEQQLCRYADGVALYETYLDVDPQHVEALIGLGFCLLEERRVDEAIDRFRAAIAADASCLAAVETAMKTASHGRIWLDRQEFLATIGLTS